MLGGKAVIDNCTIAENLGEGIHCISPTIANSIVYFNDRDGGGIQIVDEATVTYSDVQGGFSGEGNLDVDPLFVALGSWVGDGWIAGDYHLGSQGYRWDSQAGQWISDENTSPCIDAGDPALSLLDEPASIPGDVPVSNTWINMGAYGGTDQASLARAGN